MAGVRSLNFWTCWQRAVGFAGLGATILAVAIFVASVYASLAVADELAFRVESARVLNYAKDVLRRNEQTSEQVASGIQTLVRAAGANPCAASTVALMQRIDLASSNLQAIGHLVGNRLDCSSIGHHPDGLDLGPADFTTQLGYQIRESVELPFAPGKRFAVVAFQNFAVILHKDLPIDIAMEEPDGALGIFTGNDRRYLMGRGPLQAPWVKAIPDGLEHVFVRDGHLIAVLRSRQWSSGSVAALPVRYMKQRARAFSTLLIPVGVVSGSAVALVVLLLARRQRGLAHLLRRGLQKGEFFVVYQPVLDLQSGACVGAEVLLRWRGPNGELVPPDVFIQIAEDNGLIEQVTTHVLHLLAAEAGKVFEQRPHFHLAINISPADLHSDRLPKQVLQLATDLGIAPGQLTLEVTERGLLDKNVAQARVQHLRTLGIHMAIDDFGTGYSSLAYLERFNVDGLKIDKSFIDKIGTGAAASGVVGHIIEMAKELELTMVAEGVETEAQASYIRTRGVQMAQGWLFSKPLVRDELLRFLAKHPPATQAAHGAQN